MAEPKTQSSHYWERVMREGGDPPGEDLAALRSGAGRPAGSVPAMWRFYSVEDSGTAAPSAALVAEHHALVLFGFHQQSKHDRLVHEPGHSVASALHRLRWSDAYRERGEAIDGRVSAAATAPTVDAVAWHLRSLVGLLRGEALGFDYTELFRDLVLWSIPDRAARVRRRWGRDYFSWGAPQDGQQAGKPANPDNSGGDHHRAD